MATETATLTLDAIEQFLEWVNTEAEIPEGYRYQVDTIRANTKYARIVMYNRTGSRSVHAFVDLATGDLLKAESWRKPVLDPRGNIVIGLDSVQGRFNWAGSYQYAR